MLIHEYQARNLFSKYGISVTEGKMFEALDGIEDYVKFLNDAVVVKAQVHTGGRGKAGGVKFAPKPIDALEHSKNILGMNLVTHQTGPKGIDVRKILIVPAVDIAKEYYLALTMDRRTQRPVMIASTEGGVEIETVAEETPEKIIKLVIDPAVGFLPFHGRKLAQKLGFQGKLISSFTKTAIGLYNFFIEKDCAIAEINPLVETKQGELYAIDGKVNFDSNALYRQKDIAELADEHEEDPLEVEAQKHDLNYIKLDGNVACMVNGAGLAMATMDTIQIAGGQPANFLDIGGTATADRVEKAFNILLSDKNVRGVLINIFGGIVRCDLVASGVVEALKKIGKIEQPIVIRLSGTNSKEGIKILEDSGLDFTVATDLNDASQKIVNLI